MNAFRLFQPVDLDRALRALAFAVQGLRADGDLHRLRVGEPLVGGHRRGQRRIADVHVAMGRAGLAGRVGHVRIDRVVEGRLVLLRHRQVGLGDELDREGAVGLGEGRAVDNFLAGSLRGPPPAAPRPPDRVSHFADHAVADLGPVDGRPGVGRGLALEAHALAEPRGRLGRFQRHLELGPLVFLNAHVGLAVQRAFGADRHLTHEPIAGRGEAAAEGAVIVGAVRLPGDLLAVGVRKDHRHRLAACDLVVVGLLVYADTDALVLNRLSRAVERTVGEEDGPLVGPRPAGIVVVIVVGRRDLLIPKRDLDQAALIGGGPQREEAAFVGLHFGAGFERIPVHATPGLHVGAGQRLARSCVQHEAFDQTVAPVGPHHQRQATHPERRQN